MKSITDFQQSIKEFDQKRNWDYFYPYDLLLNLNEEIGEIWHLIAWVSEEKKHELIHTHKQEIENNIGDLLFLVLKLANQFNVDADRGLSLVIAEYEGRFPVDKFQNSDKDKNTANIEVGYDSKYRKAFK